LPSGKKENNNYTPERDCSQATPQKAPTTKDYYLQKRYNELICGFMLDQIQRKQVETIFNALVEFIESPKKIILLKRLNYKFFISKIFELSFPSEKNIPPPKQTNEKNQMLWDSFLVNHKILACECA